MKKILKKTKQQMKNKFLTGFTLIETIVTISIFSLLMGLIIELVLTLYQIKSFSWEESMAVNEARRGIETMIEEIREARPGENGAYPIELARDKEFIFYSDINNDGKTERVRYFLGTINNGDQTKECQTFVDGGSCSVNFSNFFTGNLTSAILKVSVKGDFNAGNEYVDIFVDGIYLGSICKTGCNQCSGTWEGTQIFNVLAYAKDNSLNLLADASAAVKSCSPQMQVQFELIFTEEVLTTELKKGVIFATGSPATYPLNEEKILTITSYVRNVPPIFEYYDKSGQKIVQEPSRLIDTKMMRVYLIVNSNPNRPPKEFELMSYVQLRNLKEE